MKKKLLDLLAAFIAALALLAVGFVFVVLWPMTLALAIVGGVSFGIVWALERIGLS